MAGLFLVGLSAVALGVAWSDDLLTGAVLVVAGLTLLVVAVRTPEPVQSPDLSAQTVASATTDQTAERPDGNWRPIANSGNPHLLELNRLALTGADMATLGECMRRAVAAGLLVERIVYLSLIHI